MGDESLARLLLPPYDVVMKLGYGSSSETWTIRIEALRNKLFCNGWVPQRKMLDRISGTLKVYSFPLPTSLDAVSIPPQYKPQTSSPTIHQITLSQITSSISKAASPAAYTTRPDKWPSAETAKSPATVPELSAGPKSRLASCCRTRKSWLNACSRHSSFWSSCFQPARGHWYMRREDCLLRCASILRFSNSRRRTWLLV